MRPCTYLLVFGHRKHRRLRASRSNSFLPPAKRTLSSLLDLLVLSDHRHTFQSKDSSMSNPLSTTNNDMSEPAPPLDLSAMTISQATVPVPVGGTCPSVCVTKPKVDYGIQSSAAQDPQKHSLETSSTSSNKGPEAETRTLFTSVAIYSAEDILQSEDTETKLWEAHGKDIVVFFVGESSRSIDRLIYKLAKVNPGPRTPSLPRIAFQATSRWYFL